MAERTRAGLDDETLGMILESLRTVSERRLGKARRLELDEEDEFPMELVREMLGPELGLHLLFLPEEVGGLGGGGRDLFRVSEEMARVDLGVATAFLAIALGVDPIMVGGTAGAEGALARPDRRGGADRRLRRHRARGRQQRRQPASTVAEPVTRRRRRRRRLPPQRHQAVHHQRRRGADLHHPRPDPGRAVVLRRRAGDAPGLGPARRSTSTASAPRTPPRSSSTTSRCRPTSCSASPRARGSSRPTRCSASPG